MKRRPKRRLKPIASEALPRAQAVLIPVVALVFEELEISVSVVIEREIWHALHLSPNVVSAEGAHGVETARWAYNERCVARALGKGKIVLGEHAGFSDFFVPVKRDDTPTLVVAGPFARSRPTRAEVLERWRAISGKHGRLGDPGFSDYLSMTLRTLTLEGELLDDFRALLLCFAKLLEALPDSERLAAEVTPLMTRLRAARYAERMWQSVPTMVDPRASDSWKSRARLKKLWDMGLKRLPEHVVVGLLVGSDDSIDPVDDVLRRDAFQRACVEFARKRGGLACGRLGDHGVAFVTDDAGKGTQQRAKLLELSRRALGLARRFGLRLHAGISAPDDRAELPARYQAALSAAEQALYGGASFEHADPGAARGENPMAVLRRRMVQVAGENPQQISPLFARFVEAAAVHCAYRLEPTRAHLEAGFEQITDALKSTGNLDERGLGDLRGALEKNAADANTIRELAAAYQPVISDLELALQRPIGAGQDRAMRRALTFVREHLTEPLPLSKVARVAGFAPRYFAKLFVRDERVTLQQYVSALRLARAKQLLASTTLTVERVRQLSGFRTRVHFHRAFKQAFGTTPTEFRNASPP